MSGGTYARGKHAFGFCDRCGFRYPLHELKPEVIRRNRTGLKTCPECWDPDHPQNSLGLKPIYDPQALRDARPDNAQAASRRLYSWDPVGNDETLRGIGRVGKVTVSTT